MKNKVFLSWFCAGAILLVVLVGTLSIGYAKQEAYPARDIVWIVPFSPGGGYDTYARGIIPYLEKYLPRKVNVVVKNIRGAGGVTGVSHLYKSKPNGYTLGYAAYPGMAVVKMTMDVGFDPGKLTPLAKIAVSPQALFVAGNSPFKSLKDLKRKGKIK